MKTNLAFALQTLDTPATVDAVAGATLDPVQLDRLLRLGSAQAGKRRRARRKLVSLKDNHADVFQPFRIR